MEEKMRGGRFEMDSLMEVKMEKEERDAGLHPAEGN